MKNSTWLNWLAAFAFTLAISSQLNAQVLLEEDFNQGWPAGWTSFDGDGGTYDANNAWFDGTGSWNILEDFDSTAVVDSIAASSSWYTPVGTADDWIITPQITLGAYGNYLTYESKSQDPSYPDGYELMISTTTPDTAGFNANAPLFSTASDNPAWTEHQIDLDAAGYAGQSIYLAWHNNSTDQFILCLDNVNVQDSLTINVNEEANNFVVNVYPNPAKEVVNLLISLNNTSDVTVDVLNSMGQKVHHELLSDISFTTKCLATGNWATGVYYVMIQTPAATKVEKLVIR
jgi:hypothetical protein